MQALRKFVKMKRSHDSKVIKLPRVPRVGMGMWTLIIFDFWQSKKLAEVELKVNSLVVT